MVNRMRGKCKFGLWVKYHELKSTTFILKSVIATI